MEQLVKIIENKELGVRHSVNARDLHNALKGEGTSKFAHWIKPKLKATLAEENIDYIVCAQSNTNLQGGRPGQDFILTLNLAKEIAMLSRCINGKKVRNYFINVEKAYIELLETKQLQNISTEMLTYEQKKQINRKIDRLSTHIMPHSINQAKKIIFGEIKKKFGVNTYSSVRQFQWQELKQFLENDNWESTQQIQYKGEL